jgi:hypothetical protein
MRAYPKFAWTEPLSHPQKNPPARLLSAADASSARALNLASLRARLAAAQAKAVAPTLARQVRAPAQPVRIAHAHSEPVSRQPAKPNVPAQVVSAPSKPAPAEAVAAPKAAPPPAKKKPSPFGPPSFDGPVLPPYARAFLKTLHPKHPMVECAMEREMIRISTLRSAPLRSENYLDPFQEADLIPAPAETATLPANVHPTIWFTTQQLHAISRGKPLPHTAAYRAEYWADRRAERRIERRAWRDLAETAARTARHLLSLL